MSVPEVSENERAAGRGKSQLTARNEVAERERRRMRFSGHPGEEGTGNEELGTGKKRDMVTEVTMPGVD